MICQMNSQRGGDFERSGGGGWLSATNIFRESPLNMSTASEKRHIYFSHINPKMTEDPEIKGSRSQ